MSLFILLVICHSVAFSFICQYIPNRLFHMPIISCVGEGRKFFLQFCCSILTLLMQNTNLYRYFQRYLSITFAILGHYFFSLFLLTIFFSLFFIYVKTITIMLLLCCFVVLHVLRMEVLLTWRNLITFYLHSKQYRHKKTLKTQTKFSFQFCNPFY